MDKKDIYLNLANNIKCGINNPESYQLKMGTIQKFDTPKDMQMTNNDFSSILSSEYKNGIVLGYSGHRPTFTGMDVTYKITQREEHKMIATNYLKWVQEMLHDKRYNTITTRLFKDHNDYYKTSGGFDLGQISGTHIVMFCFGACRKLEINNRYLEKDRTKVMLQDNTFIIVPKDVEQSYRFEIPNPNKSKKDDEVLGPSVHILIRAFE